MGKLNIVDTRFEGVYTIEPVINEDERGSFFRVFCQKELEAILNDRTIRQINHSITKKKGTVRGLHFQYPPFCETKIVKCIKGKVLDIIVDIRKNSKTFLQVFCIELSQYNKKELLIPEGFAHGFQTLQDDCELLYLHTNIYAPNNEGGLHIRDPLLDIELPLDITEISQRDRGFSFLEHNFEGIEA